ncbi:hypothetical protein DSO57_1017476 [Entomophthora muscae]|uniref:Uncharacterized protein n=1 Tax=Entomophthora muscae TaxID=34485 RepID=A0ACC2RVP2_9FUNG|nr:hypothetical protein DSO57_1017476 [Entomophthora muscae]
MHMLNCFLISSVLALPMDEQAMYNSLSSLRSAFNRIAQPSINKVRIRKEIRSPVKTNSWSHNSPSSNRVTPTEHSELPHYKQNKQSHMDAEGILDMTFGGDDHPDQFVKGAQKRKSTPMTFSPAELEPSISRGTFESPKDLCEVGHNHITIDDKGCSHDWFAR